MKAAPIAIGLLILTAYRLSGQPADLRNINFSRADSIADLYAGHSLNDLRTLSNKLTEPLSTDVEKFRAIYRWVCNNIDNDYALHLKNQRMRAKCKTTGDIEAWNRKMSLMTFKNLVDKKKTVCTGYAYLVKELASRAGISCEIVDGYGRNILSNIGGAGTMNHSWNAVLLNHNWYLCDPTWSAGAYDREQSRYVRKFEPGYFLTDPSLFVRNHYPLDTAWMLVNTVDRPSLQEFLNGPIVYAGLFSHSIEPLHPTTLDVATKSQAVTYFQFKAGTHDLQGRIELMISGKSADRHPYRVSSAVYQQEPGIYSIE